MWCYQKPGFEALLLAELQRQQQCSQFCDTVLQAGGVSVPAHGCVLSAISPHLSSALSSTPAPAEGQGRLLEFHALGACTLLHMVRLLYSGEMTGEGEKEKQQAVSAAANLGIHGLVEVTAGKRKNRSGQHTDVGVQTEPLVLEEREGRRSRWRREVRDGGTFLWHDTVSDGEKDMCTQTEELQVNTAPSVYSASSFETTDMAAFQSLAPSQIPNIPVSSVYSPKNLVNQPSSAPAAPMQASTAVEHTSVVAVAPPPPATLSTLDLKSYWTAAQEAARDVTDGEEWQDEQFEQSKGNIPGFVSCFMKLDREEGRGKWRGERRQRGTGAGTGERRPRRPRAATGGRGRRGFTQKVDVQEVGVSRQQKLFLHRWGRGTLKTGQGGGAAGRKLHLKTRELLKKAESCQRRRGRSKVWEFSQSEEKTPHVRTQRGRRNTTLQSRQDSRPAAGPQGARAKSTPAVSTSSTSVHVYNLRSLSSSFLQPSSSPLLLSPAAPYVPPASSLLHTTLPPPTPPPSEDQQEQIERLLEEVMMGLDILQNNSNADFPLSTSSTYVHSSDSFIRNTQQGQISGLLEADPGFHESRQVVSGGRVASSSASALEEGPVLQQQGEGELNKILDHLLQSCEQHTDNCHAREMEEMIGESFTELKEPHAVLNKHRKTKAHTMTSPSPHPQSAHTARPVIQYQTAESQQSDEPDITLARSQGHKTSACISAPPKRPEETPGKDKSARKRVYKRRKKQCCFSLEKKRVCVKPAVSTNNARPKTLCSQGDKQLQQMPVVKLEWRDMIPVRVTRQEHSCQSLDVESPASKKTHLSLEQYPPGGSSSEKNQPELWRTKSDPIRSRFREAHIKVSPPFLDEPHEKKQQHSSGSAKGGSSPLPAEQQSEKKGKQERHEEELTVEPQEEAAGPTWRGKKRRAESGTKANQNATADKRFCSEQKALATSETWTHNSVGTDFITEQATSEPEEVIDVETVSLRSVGGCLEQEELEEKNVLAEISLGDGEERSMEKDMESSGDEIIFVDGDSDGGTDQDNHTDTCHSRTARSAESCEDEDIDVIGGDSPVPEPVVISWTESSEGEEEART